MGADFAEEPKVQISIHRGKPVTIGQEVATEAVKASPPAGVLAYNYASPPPDVVHVFGLPLQEWLTIVGIAWIALQAGVFAFKTFVWWTDRKKRKGP